MRFESLFSRPHRIVVATIVVSFAALAPACLPDVDFGPPSTDGGTGLDATTLDGALSPHTDASPPDAADAGDASDAAPDVDPNAIGPFVENQDDQYGQTAICAVRGDALYCWGASGSNYFGEYGLPADQDASYPLPTLVPSTPAPPSHMTQLVMGLREACAVYDRTVYCNGYNGEDELGNTDAAAGANDIAVLGLPSTGVDLLAAASEATCAVALNADAGAASNVYCWGTNGEGELARPFGSPALNAAPVTGNGNTIISDVTAIAGGGYHFCAVSASLGVLCWGSADYFESGPTQPAADADTCPGGLATSCIFEPSVVALPATDAGAAEIPVAVAVGVQHSCALTQSGSVYCWGSNQFDQLGVGDGGVPTTCTNVGAGITSQCSPTPQLVIGLPPIKILRAGRYTTCAIDTMSQAWCWGDNMAAELGNGTSSVTVTAVPLEIKDNSTGLALPFSDIAMGFEGACARSLDRDTLYCWGEGLLGTSEPDASTTPSPFTPAPVLF